MNQSSNSKHQGTPGAEAQPKLSMNVSSPEELGIEELADQFMEEQRSDSPPTMEDYICQYPLLEAEIRELFPTILNMERLRNGKRTKRSDGTVVMGPQKIERLGDFRVIREIGRGGMGIVYECEQLSLNRRVALKVLPQNLNGSESLSNFIREAQFAANLHHTNIVPIYGVGQQDGYNYYVMQLINGISLEKSIASSAETDRYFSDEVTETHNFSKSSESPSQEIPLRDENGGERVRFQKKFTAREVADIGRQVASALQYAHDQGTLHRDIKPANLVLDKEKKVWITDFGLAGLERQDEPFDSEGFSGTLRYMPPERVFGTYGRQSEVYSLGITLLELATGQAAFRAVDKDHLLEQICRGGITSLDQAHNALPGDLVAILRKAVSLDSDHRYESAEAFGGDLNRFLEGQPVAARPYSPWEKLTRWAARKPALATMTALAASLAIAITLITTWGYIQIQRTYEAEVEQRKRAEQTAKLAKQVVNQIFFRFNPDSTFAEGRNRDSAYTQPVLSREAATMLRELLQFYQKMAVFDGKSESDNQVQSALSAGKVGEIYEKLGDYDAAIREFEASLTSLRHLPRAEFSKRQILVAKLLNRIGKTAAKNQNREEAATAFQAAISLVSEHEHRELPEFQLELARSYYYRARTIRPGMGPLSMPPVESSPIYRGPGTPDKRSQNKIDDLNNAVSILRKQLQSSTDSSAIQLRYLLAQCLREIANDNLSIREDSDFVAENEAIRLMTELVNEQPEDLQRKYELLATLADVKVFAEIPRDQFLIVESNFERALELATELIQRRPDVVEYQLGYIHTSYKLTILNRQQLLMNENGFRRKMVDEAIRHNQQAIQAQRRLCLTTKGAGFQAWLARFLLTQADLEFRANRSEKAYSLLSEVRVQLSELAEPFASESVVHLMRREVNRMNERQLDQMENELFGPPIDGPPFDGPRNGRPIPRRGPPGLRGGPGRGEIDFPRLD